MGGGREGERGLEAAAGMMRERGELGEKKTLSVGIYTRSSLSGRVGFERAGLFNFGGLITDSRL